MLRNGVQFDSGPARLVMVIEGRRYEWQVVIKYAVVPFDPTVEMDIVSRPQDNPCELPRSDRVSSRGVDVQRALFKASDE